MAAILNSAMLDSAILYKTLTQTNSIWLKLIHSHLTWWWQPSWIPPFWNQPSLFFLSNSLTLAKIGSHHLHKKTFTHSFWLNLMMAAILNSAMLDSAILVFLSNSLTLAKIGSHHLHKKNLHSFILTQLDDGSHLEFCHVGFRHCHLGFRHLVIFSDSLKNTLPPLWLWLKLIQSDSNSFILTQLDDGSHLEFCHVGFSHFVQNSDSS